MKVITTGPEAVRQNVTLASSAGSACVCDIRTFAATHRLPALALHLIGFFVAFVTVSYVVEIVVLRAFGVRRKKRD